MRLIALTLLLSIGNALSPVEYTNGATELWLNATTKFNLDTVEGWEELMFKSEYSSVYGDRVTQLFYPILSTQRSDHIKVKIINAGAGTTGSSTVHQLLCKSGFNAIHFYGDCNGAWVFDDTVNTFKALGNCAVQKKNEDNFFCNSTLLQESIIFSTSNALRYEAIGDTPMQWFAPMIASWVPDLAIVLTVRDPNEWVAKRRHFHSSNPDMMCHPNYWNEPSLVHPFDLYSCLSFDEDASKVIIDMNNPELTDQQLGEAFVIANIVNAHLVSRSRLLLISFFESIKFRNYNRDQIAVFELENISQFVSNNKLLETLEDGKKYR